jgi:hypothetical protein
MIRVRNQLRILAIRLLLAYALGLDLGRIANPQFELQLRYQSFEPACLPAGFHSHTHLLISSRWANRFSWNSPVSLSTEAIC